MGKKIKIGYLKRIPELNLISAMAIENNLINFLGRYTDIRIIPIGPTHAEEDFKKIKRYGLDYLYLSSFNLLQLPFFLREKLGIDIPFIFYIHEVLHGYHNLVHIIPFLRKYDKIIAPTEHGKSLFLKFSSKFDVHVIPHCLDVKEIQRNGATEKKQDRKIITFMGRVVEEKGVGILIELLPKVISKIKNVHLNIIGPLSGHRITNSPKSIYVKKIEKLIKRKKLTHRVTFKGVQLGLNKYRTLSQSDIFVNPTLARQETFGVVTLEALACGVPVIATNWAGNREIVENGKNGYLLEVVRDKKNNPHLNSNQLISLIIKVLAGKNLILRLKQNALLSAGKYDYRIVMPRFVRLLKRNKTEVNITSKWDCFKDKVPCDFASCFNDEFLFFLFSTNEFKNSTYSSLYKQAVNIYSEKSFYPSKMDEGNSTRKIRKGGIFEKIKMDFLCFLTSTGHRRL
jgi:glycosyltransferase involved in cell wall biosynthesis